MFWKKCDDLSPTQSSLSKKKQNKKQIELWTPHPAVATIHKSQSPPHPNRARNGARKIDKAYVIPALSASTEE